MIVQVGHGILVYGSPPSNVGELAIALHATNDGDGVIVLESTGLTLDSGATVMMPPALWGMFRGASLAAKSRAPGSKFPS